MGYEELQPYKTGQAINDINQANNTIDNSFPKILGLPPDIRRKILENLSAKGIVHYGGGSKATHSNFIDTLQQKHKYKSEFMEYDFSDPKSRLKLTWDVNCALFISVR